LKTLDRKVRRELKQALGRIVAILCIITTGVACYVEMNTVYHNLVLAKDSYYAQCKMADFSIELKKGPLTEIAAIAELPGVVEIRPRITFFATVDLESKPELINAQVLSLPDRRQAVINDIVLVQGGYFTDRRDNEVIVSDTFARKHRLQPGQWIYLILNNRRQDLFVVGTAISSEFVYLVGPGSIAPDPERFGVFYLKQSYAEEVYAFQGAANQVVGRLAPELRDRPEETLRLAEALLADYGVLTTTPRKDQPSNRIISEEIDGIATFSGIMPTMFLTVAALVLNVLMTRMTEQQRTVVGTLKALGYSDRQVFGHYLKFGLFIGTLGGILGCIAGFYLAGWLTSVYAKFYEFPELINRFYAGVSLRGFLISIGCAVLGTFNGARSVLKLTPAAAMRPKPPAQGRKILLERIAWFWGQLGAAWRTVLRAAFRNRFRTASGIVAAALGASILMTGLMMMASMFHLIEFQFERIQRADLELAFKDERGIDAMLEARRLPGVDHVEPVLDMACTFSNGPYRKRGAVTGLVAGARLTVPRDEAGGPIRVAPVGLTMSRMLADILHVRPGELLTVRPVRGERRDLQVPVAAITDTYLGLSVYADFEYLNRLLGEEFAVSGLQLALDGSQASHVALHRELKEMPTIQSVSARKDRIKNIMDTIIDTQETFIGVLVVFAGVIFFGSVLNSSLISLAERQREVGTLRVLGYTPWQIGGLFFRETVVINAIGTLLGLPLGYQLSVIITEAYANELFRVGVVTPMWIWTTTLTLAVVFVLVAHGFVQRSIHRMDWLDALKVKE
jgi:putative ABC transport system permease protein